MAIIIGHKQPRNKDWSHNQSEINKKVGLNLSSTQWMGWKHVSRQ